MSHRPVSVDRKLAEQPDSAAPVRRSEHFDQPVSADLLQKLAGHYEQTLADMQLPQSRAGVDGLLKLSAAQISGPRKST